MASRTQEDGQTPLENREEGDTCLMSTGAEGGNVSASDALTDDAGNVRSVSLSMLMETPGSLAVSNMETEPGGDKLLVVQAREGLDEDIQDGENAAGAFVKGEERVVDAEGGLDELMQDGENAAGALLKGDKKVVQAQKSLEAMQDGGNAAGAFLKAEEKVVQAQRGLDEATQDGGNVSGAVLEGGDEVALGEVMFDPAHSEPRIASSHPESSLQQEAIESSRAAEALSEPQEAGGNLVIPAENVGPDPEESKEKPAEEEDTDEETEEDEEEEESDEDEAEVETDSSSEASSSSDEEEEENEVTGDDVAMRKGKQLQEDDLEELMEEKKGALEPEEVRGAIIGGGAHGGVEGEIVVAGKALDFLGLRRLAMVAFIKVPDFSDRCTGRCQFACMLYERQCIFNFPPAEPSVSGRGRS
jgi:hypothetical protein